MHTLLAYTTTPSQDHLPEDFETLLPIGLCSLHALLRSRNLPVTLANLSGMSDQMIVALLKRIKPAVIGLSQWTHNRYETILLARLIKHTLPNSTVLLGGGHATHQAELILQLHPEVDIIIIGEAEHTLLELLEALQSNTPLNTVFGLAIRENGTIRLTTPRTPLKDLDLLPFPATWLHEAINVDLTRQAEFISSSRGCPAACTFCASPTFWGRRVRYRSAGSIAEEMLFIRDHYGLIYLSLRDDTFTADRRRTIALCQELIEKRVNIFWNCQSRVEAIDQETLEWMRRAGCECVQLGVESGSPRILKQLGKRITPEQVHHASKLIHESGMQLSVYLITGIPEESDADRQHTINLIKKIQPHDLQVAPLAYYPGTALFEAAVSNGKLRKDLFENNRDKAVLAQRDGQHQVELLLTRTRRYRQASCISHLTRLQRQSCYCAVTAMQIGDSYAADGKQKHAEEQYHQITQREPDHPWGWYLLGECHEQGGQHRDAARCYQHVLQLVPHHTLSVEGLRRLKH
jgi:radical SAM superfamily enzyme YgiQ (UPF0313 family)